MFSRQDYLAESCGKTEAQRAVLHRKYYGQFVTSGTKTRVLGGIGLDRLLASRDKNFNDIPLALWDRLVPLCPGSAGFEKAGDYYTIAGGVCLLKEAAQQILDKRSGLTEMGEKLTCSLILG